MRRLRDLALLVGPVVIFELSGRNTPIGGYAIPVAIALYFSGTRLAIAVIAESMAFFLAALHPLAHVEESVLVVGSAIAAAAIVVGLEQARRTAAADATWYRSLFDTDAVGIVVADRRHRIVRCNARFAEILGYDDPEELRTAHGADLTYPGAEDTVAPLAEQFEKGEIDRFVAEKQFARRDGSPVWVRVNVTRIKGSKFSFSLFEDIDVSRRATEELRTKSALLDRAQQVGGIGTWVWDRATNASQWSDEACRIYGITPAEALVRDPMRFWNFVHPDDRPTVERAQDELLHDPGAVAEIEHRMLHPDGDVRWIRSRSGAECDEDGNVIRQLGAVIDITASKLAEQELREASGLLARAQEVGGVGSWVWYPRENREIFSDMARRIFGLSEAEASTQDPSYFYAVVHPDDRLRIQAMDWDSFGVDTPSETEYRIIRRSDGAVRWVREQAVAELDEHGGPLRVLGAVADITEQRLAEQELRELATALGSANRELERLAYHDSLTGLINRVSFTQRLATSFEQAKRSGIGLALLYIDLDDFKLVNDSFGHEAGDDLLHEAAERLAGIAPSSVIGRQGGDEFVILLREVDEARALRVADAVIEAFRRPFAVLGAEVHLSASVGISLHPGEAESAEELLRHADIAMYGAKQSGRNRALVYSDDRDDALAQLSLTTGLHRALERDELILHFQPVVDLASGAVMSVEALLRWNHPVRGLLGPAEFIPAAERNGLISPISKWVAREACRHAALWQAQGLDLPVAFNLPPSLWQRGLMRGLLGTIEEFGLSADRVIVEITESSLSEDLSRSEPLVEQLHAAGLKLAIDDFGTGHSSLSRLVQLPVSTLKIDSSFIRAIPGGSAEGTLVSSIIQLAHGLGLEPLAEGIETPEQLAFLLEHGCTRGQGFLLSRPVEADEVERIYHESRGSLKRAA